MCVCVFAKEKRQKKQKLSQCIQNHNPIDVLVPSEQKAPIHGQSSENTDTYTCPKRSVLHIKREMNNENIREKENRNKPIQCIHTLNIVGIFVTRIENYIASATHIRYSIFSWVEFVNGKRRASLKHRFCFISFFLFRKSKKLNNLHFIIEFQSEFFNGSLSVVFSLFKVKYKIQNSVFGKICHKDSILLLKNFVKIKIGLKPHQVIDVVIEMPCV